MLANVRKYKLIPEEVYSKRNRLADDGTLFKVLFYDIVQLKKRSIGGNKYIKDYGSNNAALGYF